MSVIRRFWDNERGLETVEWAFVLGFVILVAVLAFVGSRSSLEAIFEEMGSELNSAASMTS